MDTLNKIIEIMESKKIKQKELTDYLGVQNTVFTKWKAGTSTSYLKHITKISEFLGVSTDYLLGTEANKKSPDKKSELEEIYSQLSQADKEKVMEYARLLLKANQ